MSQHELEKTHLWDVTCHLIALNTVSTLSNVQLADYLAELLLEHGFTVHVLKEVIEGVEKADLVAWAGPAVPGGMILSGHMDVVPFEGQPGWRTDPLTLSLQGDAIVGRGVSDMKVFLAQAVLAAQHYPVDQLKRPLVMIFTCDEELVGQGASRLVQKLPALFAQYAYPLPEVALIGEPTNYQVFPAHKGYAAFDINVSGIGGHSSDPRKGLNAIDMMGDLIQLLRAINQDLSREILPANKYLFPDVPASVLNLGLIEGGLAPNMIAETCRLTVSVRIAPGHQIEEIITRISTRIEEEVLPLLLANAPDKERVGVTIDHVVTTPSLHSPLDHDFCHLLCQIMEQKADRGAPFATDGGQFQQIGIQSYICGPGLLEQAHQPNESLPVTHFLVGQEKLEQLIYQWCINTRQG